MNFKKLLKPYKMTISNLKGGAHVRINGGQNLYTMDELTKIIEELENIQKAFVLFKRTTKR